MFYNFIKLQYKLGRLTDKQVMAFAPGRITKEQAKEIIKGGNN